MFPLPPARISALTENDIETLAGLDANGLFPGESETLEDFKERLLAIEADSSEIAAELDKGGRVRIVPGLEAAKESIISSEVVAEAAHITESAYAFTIDWAPAFYLTENMGFLWGGCAIIFDTGMPVFLIRSSFAKSRKWLWYRRDELLSHELCHVARNSLQDKHYEEMFAYRISFSAFRRQFGDCFQTKLDALLFLLPVLLLLAVQVVRSFLWDRLPIAPFWCAVGLYPLFLVLRSQFHKRRLRMARKAVLPIIGDRVDAVLFRCAAGEIAELAGLSNDAEAARRWLGRKSSSCLRWRIISHRFRML